MPDPTVVLDVRVTAHDDVRRDAVELPCDDVLVGVIRVRIGRSDAGVA